jgi:hypothetical protein
MLEFIVMSKDEAKRILHERSKHRFSEVNAEILARFVQIILAKGDKKKGKSKNYGIQENKNTT